MQWARIFDFADNSGHSRSFSFDAGRRGMEERRAKNSGLVHDLLMHAVLRQIPIFARMTG